MLNLPFYISFGLILMAILVKKRQKQQKYVRFLKRYKDNMIKIHTIGIPRKAHIIGLPMLVARSPYLLYSIFIKI